MSDDEDDEVDEYDSRIFTDWNAQNLRRIKQRKGGCFIQVSSDDEDDKDDDYDSGISPDLNVQNCVTLNKEKSIASFNSGIRCR